jgi:hypothetical protein
VTSVSAEAKFPLRFAPAKLELTREPNQTGRSGTVEVVNETAEPQQVKIVAGARWQVPASLEVPPAGRAPLLIRLAPEDTAAVRESLKLSGAGIELTLPIESPEVPAVLRAEMEKVQLKSAPGRAAVAQASIRNAGGRPGFWRIEADAPFSLESAELQLDAGQTGAIAVRLEAAESGHYTGAIRFLGEQQTVSIPVEAQISPGIAAVHAVSTAPMATQPDALRAVNTSAAAEPEQEQESRATTLRGVGVPVATVTSTTATFEWPADLTAGQPLRAEVRKLSLDVHHKMQTDWVVLDTAHFSTANGKTRAELERLTPGATSVIRISTAPRGTQGWRTLFQTPIVTPAPAHGRARVWWFLGTLLVAAAAAFVWQRRRASA